MLSVQLGVVIDTSLATRVISDTILSGRAPSDRPVASYECVQSSLNVSCVAAVGVSSVKPPLTR
jgi:hypothetical protein